MASIPAERVSSCSSEISSMSISTAQFVFVFSRATRSAPRCSEALIETDESGLELLELLMSATDTDMCVSL